MPESVSHGWYWLGGVLVVVGAAVGWLLHLSRQLKQAKREASKNRLKAELYKARMEIENASASELRNKLRDAGLLVYPSKRGHGPPSGD